MAGTPFTNPTQVNPFFQGFTSQIKARETLAPLQSDTSLVPFDTVSFNSAQQSELDRIKTEQQQLRSFRNFGNTSNAAVSTSDSSDSKTDKDKKDKKAEKPVGKDETKAIKEGVKAKREIVKVVDGTISEEQAKSTLGKEQLAKEQQSRKLKPLGLGEDRKPPTTTFSTELTKEQAALEQRRVDTLARKERPLGLTDADRPVERSPLQQVKDEIVADVVKQQDAVANRQANSFSKKVNPLGLNQPTTIGGTTSSALSPQPTKSAVFRKALGSGFDKVIAPLNVYYGAKEMEASAVRFGQGDNFGGALQFGKGLGSTTTGLATVTATGLKGLQLVNGTSSFLATSTAAVSTVSKVVPILGATTAVF